MRVHQGGRRAGRLRPVPRGAPEDRADHRRDGQARAERARDGLLERPAVRVRRRSPRQVQARPRRWRRRSGARPVDRRSQLPASRPARAAARARGALSLLRAAADRPRAHAARRGDDPLARERQPADPRGDADAAAPGRRCRRAGRLRREPRLQPVACAGRARARGQRRGGAQGRLPGGRDPPPRAQRGGARGADRAAPGRGRPRRPRRARRARRDSPGDRDRPCGQQPGRLLHRSRDRPAGTDPPGRPEGPHGRPEARGRALSRVRLQRGRRGRRGADRADGADRVDGPRRQPEVRVVRVSDRARHPRGERPRRRAAVQAAQRQGDGRRPRPAGHRPRSADDRGRERLGAAVPLRFGHVLRQAGVPRGAADRRRRPADLPRRARRVGLPRRRARDDVRQQRGLARRRLRRPGHGAGHDRWPAGAGRPGLGRRRAAELRAGARRRADDVRPAARRLRAVGLAGVCRPRLVHGRRVPDPRAPHGDGLGEPRLRDEVRPGRARALPRPGVPAAAGQRPARAPGAAQRDLHDVSRLGARRRVARAVAVDLRRLDEPAAGVAAPAQHAVGARRCACSSCGRRATSTPTWTWAG